MCVFLATLQNIYVITNILLIPLYFMNLFILSYLFMLFSFMNEFDIFQYRYKGIMIK